MAADDRTAAGHRDDLAGGGSPAATLRGLTGLARRSVLVASLIGAAALVSAGFALLELRANHLNNTVRNLQHVAYGLAEQTARELAEADRNLQRLVDAARLNPLLLEHVENREGMFGRNLASMGAASAIAYLDPEGERHYYAHAGANAAASFPKAGLADGVTVVAGADGTPSGIFVQRSLPAVRGGALVLRMSERHLAELYNVWRGQSSIAVSLTTLDNVALLKHPDAPVLTALQRTHTPVAQAHWFLDRPSALYTDPADGRDFLVASQQTPGYPLVVHTALLEEDALAAWATQGWVLVGAVVSLVLIMMLMARRHAAELSRRAAAVDLLQEVQSALALEESKLQAMFKTALESIIVIDEHGIIERVNATAERTFGYAAEELIGRNVSMLMPQPHRDLHDTYIDRYLKTGVPRLIGSGGRELVALRKDGAEFPIKLGVAEQRLPGVRRFTGTVRDITHEKLSEALLRAETRIATILSTARTLETVSADVIAALSDLGFAYGHWIVRDPATREWRAHGQWTSPALDPEAVRPLYESIPGLGPAAAVARAWQNAEVLWGSNLQTQTGSPRAAAAAAAGLHSAVAVPMRSGGEVVAVIELFSTRRDSRNEMAESALRNIGIQVGQLLSRLQAEEQLRTIVRTVPSAVFQARVGERRTIALTFMSGQVEALWGVSARSVLARPRQVLWKIPPAYRRDLLRALSRAVIRASGWDVTVPIMKDDGLRWLRVHAAPAFKRGEAPVWDGIISDVTEQKVAEQQVVRLNLDLERRVEERTQQLAAVVKELEAFSASVSHDLRAPLRGMRSYAEMLKRSELVTGEQGLMMVERIAAQGEQMENLIEALLELAQISRHELRRKDTDMSAIATAVLEDLAARDPRRSVAWTVQRGLRAYADPRMMRVIFENLLANAWKFTRNREDARIEVGTLPESPDTLYVRDNGAGFDPAYADKLFQPFQRLHPASQFEGTGIGLATVQRIVRRHGGRIWAESKPGQGATFFFEVSTEDDPHYTSRR